MTPKDVIETVIIIVTATAAAVEGIRRLVKWRKRKSGASRWLDRTSFCIQMTPEMMGILRDTMMRVGANRVVVYSFRTGEGEPYTLPRGLHVRSWFYPEGYVSDGTVGNTGMWEHVPNVTMLNPATAHEFFAHGYVDRSDTSADQAQYKNSSYEEAMSIRSRFSLVFFGPDNITIYGAFSCQFSTVNAFDDDDRVIMRENAKRFHPLYLEAIRKCDAK